MDTDIFKNTRENTHLIRQQRLGIRHVKCQLVITLPNRSWWMWISFAHFSQISFLTLILNCSTHPRYEYYLTKLYSRVNVHSGDMQVNWLTSRTNAHNRQQKMTYQQVSLLMQTVAACICFPLCFYLSSHFTTVRFTMTMQYVLTYYAMNSFLCKKLFKLVRWVKRVTTNSKFMSL